MKGDLPITGTKSELEWRLTPGPRGHQDSWPSGYDLGGGHMDTELTQSLQPCFPILQFPLQVPALSLPDLPQLSSAPLTGDRIPHAESCGWWALRQCKKNWGDSATHSAHASSLPCKPSMSNWRLEGHMSRLFGLC